MSVRRFVLVAAGLSALAIAQPSLALPLPTFPAVSTFPPRTSTWLPDPFLMENGQRVSTCAEWQQHRETLRQKVLYYVYGRMPPPPGNVTAEVTSTTAISGGEQRRITLKFGPSGSPLTMTGIYAFPTGKTGPLPVVVTSAYRGGPIDAGAVGIAMKRGFIMADIHPAEMAPDAPDPDRKAPAYKAYPDYDWGSIAVWAWGFHRAADYLFTLPEVDKTKLIYSACSRWGKTVMAAGMTDDRVALVNPHQSGSGGCAAGMVNRPGVRSETIGLLTGSFGYQFNPRFALCAGNEDRMPFDQHFAAAVIAPRAFLSTEGHTGDCDAWLNAYGSEQTVWAAKRVWDFLGAGDKILAHVYNEAHTQSTADWVALFDFADYIFKGTPLPAGYLKDRYPEDPKLVPWSAPSPVVCNDVDGGPGSADAGGAVGEAGTGVSADTAGAGSRDAPAAIDDATNASGNKDTIGGAAVSDAKATADARSPADGTNSTDPLRGQSSTGCGCRIASHNKHGQGAIAFALVALSLLAARRSRRAR